MTTPKPKTIDEYIAGFPSEIQERLWEVRETIKKTVPTAEEKISYGMPCFKKDKMGIWFAGFKNHIGFYPIHDVESFQDEMERYKGKGTTATLQFPHDKPLPFELITKVVKYKFGVK